MIDPKKKIRETLFSVLPLSYRIVQKTPSKQFMNRKLFIDTLKLLKEIDDRRDFMQEEIGIDVNQYEDKFFRVIENLMNICFNKQQLGLIRMYLYDLLGDKEWDGTITIKRSKKEETHPFKEPQDVWKVINFFS